MRKALDTSRVEAVMREVGERAIGSANPPTGFGPSSEGSFNVRRRGEPPGW